MTFNRFQLHVAPPNGTPRPAEVTVTGEVDAATADQFLRAVHELPGPRPLIVNLSPAFYFDSAGFAALDRLLADHVIVLVIEPDSALFKAAELMCMSSYLTTADARQALQ
jgi:anti-anti-sigma regulatory factor